MSADFLTKKELLKLLEPFDDDTLILAERPIGCAMDGDLDGPMIHSVKVVEGGCGFYPVELGKHPDGFVRDALLISCFDLEDILGDYFEHYKTQRPDK